MKIFILALAFLGLSFCTTTRQIRPTNEYKMVYSYDARTKMCYAVFAYTIKTEVFFSATFVPCTAEVLQQISENMFYVPI